jgi:hypothetical protein
MTYLPILLFPIEFAIGTGAEGTSSRPILPKHTQEQNSTLANQVATPTAS